MDLTFQRVNQVFGSEVFSFDGDNVTLNVGAITGDTYGGLTDMGIIEFAYKLMKVFYDTQVDFNLTRTTNRLNSFSSPFYGSVQNTTTPKIIAGITVIGEMPLAVDTINGTNV